jgi:RHH-type transcriptional regulator, rel operon repressor / antitoxin RelB
MTSATFTVRLDNDEKRRLEALAASTGRSRSFLAADAIRAYLEVQEWQVAGIGAAMKSTAEHGGIGHSAVKSWVASWDEAGESKRPKPQRR